MVEREQATESLPQQGQTVESIVPVPLSQMHLPSVSAGHLNEQGPPQRQICQDTQILSIFLLYIINAMTTEYIRVENNIQEALKELQESTKPNVAETARQHGVPKSRLRTQWKGRQSHYERPTAGKRLTNDQDLALRSYINYLNSLYTAA